MMFLFLWLCDVDMLHYENNEYISVPVGMKLYIHVEVVYNQ